MRRTARIRSIAALSAAALGVAGCGGAGKSDPPIPIKFPGLGYRYQPPRLPAGLPAGAVLVVDMTNAGSVRPAGLRFASDGTLSGARWSAWGAVTTAAQGTATVRICTPNCGGGHDARYPARMVLSGIKLCGHHHYYERAQVTLTTAKGPEPWGAYIHAPCA